jgi:hypothetical protein
VAQQQQFTEQRKPSQPAHNNQYGAVQQPAQQPARANRCYQVSIDVIYVLCAIVAMVARVRYLLGRNLAVLKFMTWCFMKFLPFSAGCRAGLESVGYILIWGLWKRNCIRNMVPVSDTRKWRKQLIQLKNNFHCIINLFFVFTTKFATHKKCILFLFLKKWTKSHSLGDSCISLWSPHKT